MTNVPSQRDERLERVLADYLHGVEAGMTPDRAELLRQNPDLAADLDSFFRNRDAMERIAEPLKQQVPDAETIGILEARTAGGPSLRYFGDYELLEEIARGGMGVVYRARQVSLGRIVAVKMILAGQLALPADVARFRAEAEAAAGLDHVHIVPIYEIGEHDGQHYFSMKFIEGGSLSASPRTTIRGLVDRLVKVARAVHHAHQRGILHRDLKPGNILIDAAGEPHVTDFGLAKRVEGGSDLTRSGAIVGTPSYMAPEQARSAKALTTAVDVYSLGAILYELLTGRPPFRADTPLNTVLQVLQDDPVPPHGVDHDLTTITLKCLNKDPRGRYDSAAALADDLERWLRHEPITARPAGGAERLAKWVRRKPAAAALVTVSGLALAALFGMLVYFNEQLQEQVNRAEQGEAAALVQQTRAENNAQKAAENAANEATERRRADAEADTAWANQYLAHMHLMQADWEQVNLNRLRTTLDLYRTPPAGRQDVRGWEWHYQNHLCNGELRTFKGHTNVVHNVAFSADGSRLASAGSDGTVRLWDVSTGLPIRTLKSFVNHYFSVAFSPDGAHVAAGGSGRVLVWDTATGIETATAKAAMAQGGMFAFSPDGKRLVTESTNGMIKVWDMASGAELHAFRGHNNEESSIQFDLDGTQIVTAGRDHMMRWWDPTTGKVVRSVLVTFNYPIGIPARSPDGRLFATGTNDRMIMVWDAASGIKERELKGHRGAVHGVAFSPDGTRLASASGDRTIKLWDLADSRELRTLKGHTSGVQSVAFSPDGLALASAGMDGTVKLWDVGPDKEAQRMHQKNFQEVKGIAFSPDGTRLASVGGGNVLIELWDTATGQALQAIKTHAPFTTGVTAVAFSPDGTRLASAGGDVELWDATNGQLLRTLKAAARNIVFSPDGARLATVGGDTAKVWDIASGVVVGTFQGPPFPFADVAFSGDSTTFFAVFRDRVGTLQAWDIASGRKMQTAFVGTCGNAVFNPATTCLAAPALPIGADLADPGTVRLFDLESGRQRYALAGHSAEVWRVAFSANGTRLACACRDGSVKLWDLHSGQELRALQCGAFPATVTFSADGTRLAVGSTDAGTIVLWDARPLTAEVKAEIQAVRMLQTLFAKPLPASAVRAAVERQHVLSPSARQKALDLLRRFHEETDPEQYYRAAWLVLRTPYANRFAVETALAQMRAAHAKAAAARPINAAALARFHAEVGIAHYRLGRYQKDHYREALALLAKIDGKDPTGLAFLAMTQHQLGLHAESRATLDRSQKLLAAPGWAGVPVVQRIRAEAEQLIQGTK